MTFSHGWGSALLDALLPRIFTSSVGRERAKSEARIPAGITEGVGVVLGVT